MLDDVTMDSLLAHAGGGHDPVSGALTPPIPVSTTFVRDETYALTSDDHVYVRDHDDAVRRVEGVVQRLEGAAGTLAFASGMAAITAVARWVRPGETLLLDRGVYWGAIAMLRRLCAHGGVTLLEVDCADTAATVSLIAEQRPRLVFVEALSNPMLRVIDVPALAAATRAAGGRLAVDATVPTPLSLRPLALGADLAVHAATKSLNGHSDLLAGLVSTGDADDELWAWLTAERHDAGAVLGPFAAWLLLRGMRTLPLRHDRACANAVALAAHLDAHPAVDLVLHPSLPAHPGHDLAATMCTRGVGSLLSVRVAGGAEAALRVAGALRLCVRATSLGGMETLVEHRWSVEQGVTDVPQDLLRVSVGVEDVADLLADWTQALDAQL